MPRVEVCVAHLGLPVGRERGEGVFLHAGMGGLKDTTFLSSSLLGPLYPSFIQPPQRSKHAQRPTGSSRCGPRGVTGQVITAYIDVTHTHSHMQVVRGTAYNSSQMSAPAWESVPGWQQPQIYHSRV